MDLEKNVKAIRAFRLFLIFCAVGSIPVSIIPVLLRGQYDIFVGLWIGMFLTLYKIVDLSKTLRKLENEKGSI